MRNTVIGVGNPFRRDDGVGVVVARALQELRLPDTTILERQSNLIDLPLLWTDAEHVILIDAVQFYASPGYLRVFNARHQPLPTVLFACSTHAFGLAHVVELARMLHRLPLRLTVYAIEGKDFAVGNGLSPEVEHCVPEVVARIVCELKCRQDDEMSR